jgi:ABC-type phosphate transport system substrate-binding protein
VKLSKSIVMAAGGFRLLAVALSGPASADTNVGSTTTLAGVGSDTSQDVMEGLSGIITDGGNPAISNYKATPVGRDITTRPGCTFTAPKNSGEGRDALSAAMRHAAFGTPTTQLDMTGCVDFARSSSGGNPTTSPGVGTMTYIPFATDAVTYATLGVSAVPHVLTKAQLVQIYSASGTPGGAGCIDQPLLPPQGSGTRTFFLQSLGLADVAIGAAGGPGTCVQDTLNGVGVQEHDGRFITNSKQLAPFSTSQYIGQSTGSIPNQLGRATLGAIDFAASDPTLAQAQSSMQINPSYTFTRPLYNVVPTSQTTGNTLTQRTFVGSTSYVCTQTQEIKLLGLIVDAACGSVAKTNT